jgi:hypothetical protein
MAFLVISELMVYMSDIFDTIYADVLAREEKY